MMIFKPNIYEIENDLYNFDWRSHKAAPEI